jgi:hypothetical protein
MLKFKHYSKPKSRIRELERRSPLFFSSRTDDTNKLERANSSFLVLPVTYTPAREPSPKLEIVPYSIKDQSKIPLILVEPSKTPVYETLV